MNVILTPKIPFSFDSLTKTCKICELDLPLSSFHKNRSGKHGRHNECKRCRATSRKIVVTDRPVNGLKFCSKCKEKKNVQQFYSDKSSSDGLQTYCKECQHKMTGKWASTLDGFATKIYHDIKKRLTDDVRITKTDIVETYIKQDGRCAITGERMTHLSYVTNSRKESISTRWNISVDLIKEQGNYEKDNIQLVGSIIHRMKCGLSIDDFKDICGKVISDNKQ